MSDLEDEIVRLSTRITCRITRLSLSSHIAGDELTLHSALPATAPDNPCTPPVTARGNRRLVAEATPTTLRQPTPSGVAEERQQVRFRADGGDMLFAPVTSVCSVPVATSFDKNDDVVDSSCRRGSRKLKQTDCDRERDSDKVDAEVDVRRKQCISLYLSSNGAGCVTGTCC